MPKKNTKPTLAHDPADERQHTNKRKPHRQNIDHLLNFNLPPRVQAPPPVRRHQSSKTSGGFRDASTQRDRFIHARYRFMMNPTGDYTAHFADPDIHHYWPNVLQVLVATNHSAQPGLASFENTETCPVCWEAPAAPRLTKCGHIYCYPCLLHLFGLSDAGKWAKCPICDTFCHPKDLKSVAFVPINDLEASLLSSEEPPTEEYLSLRLMERPHLTTLALPRSSTWPSEAVPHLSTPWHFSPDAYAFSRFMLASPEYMLDALSQDLQQLEALLLPKTDDLEAEFITAAKNKVLEQMAKAQALKTQAVQNAKRQSLREIQTTLDSAKQRQVELERSRQPEASTSSGGNGSSSSEEYDDLPRDRFTSASSPSAPGLSFGTPPPSQLALSLREQQAARNRKGNLNPPPPESATFFFYQAANGSNVFLHPLDIKILRNHFGNYAVFPDNIRVRVEGKDEGSITEDLRRRCKYLTHLPLGSDVTFLEVDLEPVVGSKSVEPYAGALKMRRDKRKNRARREDRAKVKSEEREREQHHKDWGIRIPSAQTIPPPRPHSDIDDNPALTPPSPSHMPSSLESTGPKTIWGTRKVEPTHVERRAEESDGEAELNARWAYMEQVALSERLAAQAKTEQQQQKPAGPTPKKKRNKPVSLTAGGGRGW